VGTIRGSSNTRLESVPLFAGVPGWHVCISSSALRRSGARGPGIREKEETVRKLFICAALVAVGVVVLAVGSYANGSDDDWGGRFSARLHGYQEVPANSTTGRGTFVARLIEPTVLEYRLRYANLEGTPTLAAHIHLGQRTANGGVSAFLCGGGDKPPCTPTNGEIEGTIDPADVIGPAGQGIAAGEFNELIRAMRAGVTYANVHTTKHPGGEIRGQIELYDKGHDDRHERDHD
jgi:CHRD domain-containing protein